MVERSYSEGIENPYYYVKISVTTSIFILTNS